MTKNALPATISPVYPQGTDPETWKSTEPAGGTIIANPWFKVDFNGLSDGQSVVNTAHDPGSVDGKRFDACLGDTGFENGFGIQADTAVSLSPATSSCKQSIAAGSEGDPAGGSTGAGYGAFGGIKGYPAEGVGEGEEFWFGLRIFIPLDFDFSTNTGFLKYIRMDTTNSVGRIEYMVVNGAYGNYVGAETEDKQVGWGLVREGAGNDKAQSETMFVSNRLLNRNAWNWFEGYMLASSDPAIAVRRIWINEQFACERVGNVNKHINASGVLTTAVIATGEKILPSSSDIVTNIYTSTYWNGDSPQDQAWWIQKIVGHKNASEVLGVDAYGNKMMGPQ